MNSNQIKTFRYQNEHNQSNLEGNNIEKMLKASDFITDIHIYIYKSLIFMHNFSSNNNNNKYFLIYFLIIIIIITILLVPETCN